MHHWHDAVCLAIELLEGWLGRPHKLDILSLSCSDFPRLLIIRGNHLRLINHVVDVGQALS